MNWISILWAATSAICLTLGLVHALVCVRDPQSRSNAAFAIAAFGTAGMAICELWMLKAKAAPEFAAALRWFHIPVLMTFLALLGLVRSYLGGGRAWLAWAAALTRAASLVLNFVSPVNLNYSEIRGLRQATVLGETIAIPDGVANPWMLVGQASLVLLLAFVVDAAVSAWRRGSRRPAMLVGGTLVFFVVGSAIQAILVFWGVLRGPITASAFFAGTVAVMGYELSSEPLRAARLERELGRRALELAHLARVASLTELSGSLAHEMNQPLAVILSNAQAAQRLLEQEPPDLAEVRQILADIVREDRRAGDVIARLRALLKRGEPNRQLLDVNAVVDDVLTLVRRDLATRGVGVVRELGDGLLRILGDRIPLEQVILNLVMNACDAMDVTDAGHRRLTITTRADGATIRVTLRDSGRGLPEDAERIFDPFFTTKKNGLGMGLSICRTIVEAHGGRIQAERNPEGGATLHVELPAEAAS